MNEKLLFKLKKVTDATVKKIPDSSLGDLTVRRTFKKGSGTRASRKQNLKSQLNGL